MKPSHLLSRILLALTLSLIFRPAAPTFAQTNATPDILGLSRPAGGQMQLFFRGNTGPYRVQSRSSLSAAAPWFDIVEAKVSEIQTGVFMALLPTVPQDDLGFYRVVNENETIAELKGWTYLVQVSAPANKSHFVAGESPVITVTILDNYAQGITRDTFSTLNLYMHGPEDSQLTKTAVKLLNATTDRTKTPHHYIDLKKNADVQVKGNVLTYTLEPVTDEAPGTYTVTVYAVRGDDLVQQLLKFATVQIGTATVENPTTTKASCTACHEGTMSGKVYMHHADVGRNPFGTWAIDLQPEKSCKACHNNDGYAAFTDATAVGGRRSDHIVIRAHGVHMGEHLSSKFNTNSTTGNFRDYLGVVFPADVRNCTTCHVDDNWKTRPTRLACGSCHDNTWFGSDSALPAGMVQHTGGSIESDTTCVFCHKANTDSFAPSITKNHAVPPPKMDLVDVTLTPPANGTHYVAGEAPVVTLVIRDDAGNPIDHTKVTDANFSTASLFVYGPRARAVPVLTSAARNVNSKLRASVSSSKAGPWDIKGQVFKLAINGSAPQEIVINGAANLVTAAEVVASLNPVITNLNGGATATVSGANVNIRTATQGTNARVEIYNGPVTLAMGWKRGPNTVMDPDITIAAGTTPANDLRGLSDPLDYADPMVTRTAARITYQLADVAGLPAGTYNIYVYHLPKAGKIAGMTNLTGIGHLTFQVGTSTPEKMVATRCADCHSDTIFHLASGPIHAEPFDTDYCNACHDYGHTAPGEMFKNQGGTSLSGWSGYGAMPISRRVHGVHYAHYLEHSEEIYANATKETFGEIIFPQDIRNCTKCHAESDSWKRNPSRMACLACHDSDEAKAHGTLMTLMPDPADPYGPSAIETCDICHGAGAESSADKVHQISQPYRAPYPREKAE